ncbi:MAG: hypothetical protein ACI4I0_07795 [Acutalibacteraceae bacterium]
MKKGKKIAIIIAAVVLAAAVTVGGLILGGVIPVGNGRTASAKELTVDETSMNAYRTLPQVYETTLKTLYGMSEKEVADFYSNDAEGWGVYSQKVLIKNNSKTAIVVANAQSDANGSGNMWIFSRASDLNYITVLPGESGEFSFNVLVKGYSSEKEIRAQLKKLAPTIVYAENKNAANQSFVKFDMTNAEKFTLDIKF